MAGRVQKFGECPGYIGEPACFGERSNFAGDQANVRWHIQSMSGVQGAGSIRGAKSTIRAREASVDRCAFLCSPEVKEEPSVYEKGQAMRRFLIALTLVLLLAVSVGIGVLVAGWPRWQLG